MTRTAAVAQQSRFQLWGNWGGAGISDFSHDMDVVKDIAHCCTASLQEHERLLTYGLFIPHIYLFPAYAAAQLREHRKLVTTSDRNHHYVRLQLGVQNLQHSDDIATMGEHTARLIKSAYRVHIEEAHALVGHEERRRFYDESDAQINLKMKAAYEHGILPYLCIGETEAERMAGKTREVLHRQLNIGLFDVSAHDFLRLKTTIIYQPRWATETGGDAPAAIANDIHRMIRSLLHDLFKKEDESLAAQTSILFGGTITVNNATSYFEQPHIDGALLESASKCSATFIRIFQQTVDFAQPGGEMYRH